MDILEMPQQLDLTQGPLGKHGVIERGDALDGDGCARGEVRRSAASLALCCDSVRYS